MTIESLAIGGRGVGRVDGRVWFVPGALPGDRVLAEGRRLRRRFVEAHLLRLIEPASARRSPACPIQPRCGGCPLMPLDEGEQLRWKVSQLAEALRRIGGLADPPIETPRAPTRPLGYRNRVEFTVRAERGRPPIVGFHGRDVAGDLVDVERCRLQDESANRVLVTARRWLGRHRSALPRVGELRLGLRRSERSGRLLVTVRETPGARLRGAGALARELREQHPEVSGVVRVVGRPGRRGGTRAEVLSGRGWLEERVAGLDLRLPARSFSQVSGSGAETLAQLVVECAAPVSGARIVDLYCGVGVHGLVLLRAGARTASFCDADAEAIACARRAARAVGRAEHARFVVGDVADWLACDAGDADRVVVNPPRRGLGAAVVSALRRLGSRRLVVVSCDPATLARDLGGLTARGGYRAERIVPVELFPQTARLETVVQLSLGRTG